MNKRFRVTAMILLIAFMTINSMGFVYASNPGWGKNTYDFVKDLAWWLALAAVVIFAVKFIAKRAWVQLGGFLFLGGIVLVIIDDPTRIQKVALTVWNFIFR